MKRLACVLLSLAGAACSGPAGTSSTSSSSSGSSSGGSQPLTPESAYRQVALANCAKEERCAATLGKSFTTRAACEASSSDFERIYSALGYANLYAEASKGLQITDQAKAQACLDKMATSSCMDPGGRDPECDAVLTPTQPKAADQQCGKPDPAGDELRCGTGLYCTSKGNTGTCSVCKAFTANGGTCSSNSECTSGFCQRTGSPSSGTCAAPAFKQRSQSCLTTEECAGNLVCSGVVGQTTCQDRGGVGSACGGSSQPSCLNDLACVTDAAGANGVCTAMLADGASCRRVGLNEKVTSAPCLHLCTFASASAAMGTCGLGNGPLAAGQPCAGYQGGFTGACQSNPGSNVYADLGFTGTSPNFTVTSCVCATTQPSGGMCFLDNACEDGNCTGQNFTAMPATKGMCGPKSANGVMCRGDGTCDSGYCDGATSKCAVKPACP